MFNLVQLWSAVLNNPFINNTQIYLGSFDPPDTLYAVSVLVIQLLLRDGGFAYRASFTSLLSLPLCLWWKWYHPG